MKKDLEACGHLVRAAKVIKDIESSKLFKSLNEQLNIYNKCNDAVDLLRKDEKKKKREDRESLIGMKNFNELETALRSVTIEESKSLFKYVQKLRSRIEERISEYEAAMRSQEKETIKFWRDLLEKFTANKIPVRCDEECMIEEMIHNAEEMENIVKTVKKATGKTGPASVMEVLERYRV